MYTKVKPEDKRVIEILDKTSRYLNDEWEVGLLWKSDENVFSNGRITALHRLYNLEKKLDRDSNYTTMYYKEMERFLENGFAQKAEKEPMNDRVWYLPHFGVQNANNPNEVRLVFDAAAKTQSTSFNDLLLTRPDLLKSLPGVIMRFRQFSYAIKGDIHDIFLKVKIKKDRDAQRFLWRGKDRESEPDEYVMTSMLFGAKSSPCTALYIKNKNAVGFSDRYPDTANSIINNCYMDDYLDSCETAEEASERVKQVIEINSRVN